MSNHPDRHLKEAMLDLMRVSVIILCLPLIAVWAFIETVVDRIRYRNHVP